MTVTEDVWIHLGHGLASDYQLLIMREMFPGGRFPDRFEGVFIETDGPAASGLVGIGQAGSNDELYFYDHGRRQAYKFTMRGTGFEFNAVSTNVNPKTGRRETLNQ